MMFAVNRYQRIVVIVYRIAVAYCCVGFHGASISTARRTIAELVKVGSGQAHDSYPFSLQHQQERQRK